MNTELKLAGFGNFQFCKRADLVKMWIEHYFLDKIVVVLYDSYRAFDSIPMLNNLKNDNPKVYIEGIQSDFTLIEFETPENAYDFVFSFDDKKTARWDIYNCGEFHMKSN